METALAQYFHKDALLFNGTSNYDSKIKSVLIENKILENYNFQMIIMVFTILKIKIKKFL